MHLPGDTPSCRGGRRHVAAIANVLPATRLVCPDVVGTDQCPFALCDEGLSVGSEPVLKRLFAANAGVDGVCLAGTDHRSDDLPDRILVASGRLPYQHV
jgi:hypothetical protein